MKRTPLVRRTALRPGSQPMKRTRLPFRNAKRHARKFKAAFLSKEYVRFVHELGCTVPGCTRTDIQAAHVGKTRKNGGTWYEVVPLCAAHHREQEGRTAAFERKYRTGDLLSIASAVALRFRQKTQPVEYRIPRAYAIATD